MKLSVCADMMFSEYDFYDRFEPIKKSGIDTAEFWGWSNRDIKKIKKITDALGMNISVFCVDSDKDYISDSIGDNIINSGRMEEFTTALLQSAEIADYLGAAGLIVTLGNNIEGMEYERQLHNVSECLESAKEILKGSPITLLAEPINRFERPSYLMPDIKAVAKLIESVDSPNVKILYDIYHQSMNNDFNLEYMINSLDRIGHIHVADCPGRHEPGTGKLDYKTIFAELNRHGYKGYAGLEYIAQKKNTQTIADIKSMIEP